MDLGHDIHLYDPAGRLLALVQINARGSSDADWARQFLRNMSEGGEVAIAPYFVIATPGRLYFWRDLAAGEPIPEPTSIVDAAPFFAELVASATGSRDQISGETFEMIVAFWLIGLAGSNAQETHPVDALPPDFVERLQGGRVEIASLAA